jgi:hypothetical protein
MQLNGEEIVNLRGGPLDGDIAYISPRINEYKYFPTLTESHNFFTYYKYTRLNETMFVFNSALGVNEFIYSFDDPIFYNEFFCKQKIKEEPLSRWELIDI